MKNTLLCLLACGLILSACNKENNCLNGERIHSLPLPAMVSLNIDYRLYSVSNETHDCLGTVLGKDALKTPRTLDIKYKTVLSFHGEDTTLVYASIPHDSTFLFKLDSTERYTFFLLHEETGREMEGDHYDILFTVTPAGKLIDNVIAGALGINYQREFSIAGPAQFEITETSGHEDISGPWYKGVFRVEKDGKFALTGSETGTGEEDGEFGPWTAAMEYASSLITVASDKPLLQAIEKEIFVESLSKEYLEEKEFGNERVYIAIGQADFADFVVFLLKSPQEADGRKNLFAESWVIPKPAVSGEIVNGSLIKTSWAKTSEGNYSLTLTLRYDLQAEGGDAATGEPATTSTEKEYVFTYSTAAGFKLR